MPYQRLHASKLALSAGIVTGLCVFITTMLTALFGLWPTYTAIITDIYGILGFTPTVLGAFLGAIYGFIDGFIFFVVFAWIYNRLL